MSADTVETRPPATSPADGIPISIVRLNRAVLVAGIVIGLIAQQPLFTTALFVILVCAILFGPRGSLIFQLGRRLFARRIATDEREDRRLMRFNNSIAAVLLGAAQPAFVFGAPLLGWALALMVAVAASIALAGFCIGCFLYFQLKLHRYKIFGA